MQINRVRLLPTLFSVSLNPFFPVWSLFSNTIFPFGLFFFILNFNFNFNFQLYFIRLLVTIDWPAK